jgi:class 3 adenylate cyclase
VSLCSDGAPLAFEPIGPVPLKGVSGPVPLYRAARHGW